MGLIDSIIYMIWRGFAIGVIISAPMGPVGILCVQRTLEKGRRAGFFTGIGASISDLFYCLLTGFGLSFIEDFLTRNQNILQLVGSVVLIGFGIYLFKSNPARKLKKPDEGISDKKNLLNGFLFTFSNPLIIFLIIGLFARFNFALPDIQFYHYIIGFLSIAAGALAWWWVVTFFVAKLRKHFNVRSMWLINKIIGGLILIFSIVGIVSAVSALASASEHKGKVVEMHGISSGNKAVITFRAANLHNAPGKSYAISDEKGSPKVKHPHWGILIKEKGGQTDTISIYTRDNHLDETYGRTALLFNHSDGMSEEKNEGFDFFTGENAYRLTLKRDSGILEGGNREYKPILSWRSEYAEADSIGFFVSPGGELAISYWDVDYPETVEDNEVREYGNKDILETYLLRSGDKREGIYVMLDRSLDEDYLRPGGNYRLAMVADGTDGYELIYLSGAEKEAESWQPGMVKASLRPTGIPEIYDVIWRDAAGRKISTEVKAQISLPIISISFPYLSSEIRLRKVSDKLK
ncbi:MAG: LysE family translocator [Muribaculaceae bacterium]|nr:LysE family translocator [Muribaculaceae bacterium]